MPGQALIVIDVQNDYFPDGQFPLADTAVTLARICSAIGRARANGVPVILIQHVSASAAPFFNAGTEGVGIHPDILAAAPDAVVVTKTRADSFAGTTLEAELSALGIEELLLCGMMTHNCVTHTAISPSAERYLVKILTDCCCTVSPMIHAIALNAIERRTRLVMSAEALPPVARAQ